MMKKIKKTKGITLVALVVTIIVLIILASVSINLILGNNGIITKARDAKANYEKAANEEKEGLLDLYSELEEKLISNNNDIMFKITHVSIDRGGEHDVELEYRAQKGMTWRQWLMSSYYDNFITKASEDLSDLLYIGDERRMGDSLPDCAYWFEAYSIRWSSDNMDISMKYLQETNVKQTI